MSDITGKKFNKLTAISKAEPIKDSRGKNHSAWLFLCECGKEKVIKKIPVVAGRIKTCGCGRGRSKNQEEKMELFLTKENLEKYLPIYSANYIAKTLFAPDFTTTAATVIRRAKNFGIETHTFSDARLLENTQKMIKETCLERYGFESVSDIPSVKEKKIQSALDKYGCINVFQAEEVKKKSKQTFLERYGVTCYSQLGLNKSSGRLSKFHKQIQDILDVNKIKYESEVYGRFLSFNEYQNSEYSPIVDILIEDSKLVIECNGDFWHANPEIYKENDIFHTWEGAKTAREIWEKDESRKRQIESFGYKVLVIWQLEYDKDRTQVEKRILNAIKNSKNKKTRNKPSKI